MSKRAKIDWLVCLPRDCELENARVAVREALKRGVNYIDTAPYYGEGKSEEALGKILKDVPRSAYYIATKVARYRFDPSRAFDFSREATIKSVNDSIEKLGLNYVDVVQASSLNPLKLKNFLWKRFKLKFCFRLSGSRRRICSLGRRDCKRNAARFGRNRESRKGEIYRCYGLSVVQVVENNRTEQDENQLRIDVL